MQDYGADELMRVRGVLVEVATRQETISYTDLADRARLDWNHKSARDRELLGQLLGEVSREEYERGRPLLTAIVVRKGEEVPGPGFGVMTKGLALPTSEEFWSAELRRVHEFWRWRGAT